MFFMNPNIPVGRRNKKALNDSGPYGDQNVINVCNEQLGIYLRFSTLTESFTDFLYT